MVVLGGSSRVVGDRELSRGDVADASVGVYENLNSGGFSASEDFARL